MIPIPENDFVNDCMRFKGKKPYMILMGITFWLGFTYSAFWLVELIKLLCE